MSSPWSGFGRWLLAAGFLLLQLGASGQYRFRHINKQDGLSQNSVFCIAQDQDGFMWFGTRDGLNRYDGYRMVVHRHEDGDANSLADNDVRSLYFDRQTGSLWVGTLNGLSRYRTDTDDFVSYMADGQAGSLLGGSIRCLLRDRQGRLWVGTNRGLHLFDDRSGTFQVIRGEGQAAGALPSHSIRTLYEDLDGQLWVGTEEGLNRLVGQIGGQYEFERVLHKGGVQLPEQHIKAMAQEASGAFWIGTHSQGLFRWAPASGTLRQYRHEQGKPRSLSDDNIRSVQISSDGAVWIGTFVGLNRYRPGSDDFEVVLNQPQSPSSLSSNSVHSIFFDHRGSMWVGTYYGGVDFYDVQINRFRNLQQRPDGKGLSHNVVSSFWEDANGNLWIGTEGGGLNFYDRRTGEFRYYTTENGLGGNNVKTLLQADDFLWIGFFSAGLDRMDLRTGAIKHYRHFPGQRDGLPDNNIYRLLADSSHLWIASYGGGLSRMSLATETFTTYQAVPGDSRSLCSNLARIIFKDKAGQYWVGTDSGLDGFEWSGTGSVPEFRHLLEGVSVYAISQSRDGSIWVGTYSDGLFQLDETGAVIQQFAEAEGLPGHTVFGILESKAGHLWLTTNNGLAKLDRRDNSFTVYNYSDGIQNLEFNFNAYYTSRSGELLFGGTNGATLFRPEDIKVNTFVPPVVFTSLKSFNQPVKAGGERGILDKAINETASLVFDYNQANFSLSFAALDYLNPSNNHYSYRLEGMEEEWTFTKGETEATYTLQRPGTYRLRLRAGNNDGLWNPQERHIQIEVRPPLWRTGWAYLAYALLVGLVIWGAVRYLRLRYQLEMEELEKQQQRSLHQSKLRFFTNIAHEFRTPLTLIIGPLEELLREQKLSAAAHRKMASIGYNADRLLNLVNQLLNFRKLEADHERMQAAEGNIVRFLREIHLSFQEHALSRGIDYQFHASAEEILLFYDRDKMEKVIFNLLSNAFKFTPDGGAISLSVAEEGASVSIAVQDTGKGIPIELQEQVFKRFYEKEAAFQHSFKGTGIGLAISRELVRLHHGAIEVVSEEGKGALFKVRLPKGRQHLAEEDIIEGFRDSEDIRQYVSGQRQWAGAAASVDPQVVAAPSPDAPQLLIIEDNEEVRSFIVGTFGQEYRILTAANGQAGLTKAAKKMPDLIISDVMMPKMDGITLCRKLKTDIATSHIPVLLLTARTGLIFKLEGLETGADDYLTKPFSPQELKLRVRNLLAARQQLREKFGRIANLAPKEVAVTSADEAFLDQALRIAEAQIGNPSFTVEDFASALNVSRPLLFVKFKALTNLTPNNFLKEMRLKRAAHLLKQQKLNVAEVAYAVGFRDPRYFSKCFQAAFGQTPSAFMSANP